MTFNDVDYKVSCQGRVKVTVSGVHVIDLLVGVNIRGDLGDLRIREDVTQGKRSPSTGKHTFDLLSMCLDHASVAR